MAKPARRKLKVFQAQFGFHDSVVAAPSRAAALRAWGTHQDLFASGQAAPTDDPQAVDAARAHPETPLRRAVGSHEPFALEAGLPEVPASPRRPKRAAAPQPPKPPPEPDRSAVDAAEAELAALEAAWMQALSDFRRREAALAEEMKAAKEAHAAARKAAAARLDKARDAFRRAGRAG